jgi:hypothetical protein
MQGCENQDKLPLQVKPAAKGRQKNDTIENPSDQNNLDKILDAEGLPYSYIIG